MTYVLVIGNAFSGLTLYGPFDDYDDAVINGENCPWEDYVVVPINEPINWEEPSS